VGWVHAIIFGFVLQAVVLAIYGYMVEWVEQGKLPQADPAKSVKDSSPKKFGGNFGTDV